MTSLTHAPLILKRLHVQPFWHNGDSYQHIPPVAGVLFPSLAAIPSARDPFGPPPRRARPARPELRALQPPLSCGVGGAVLRALHAADSATGTASRASPRGSGTSSGRACSSGTSLIEHAVDRRPSASSSTATGLRPAAPAAASPALELPLAATWRRVGRVKRLAVHDVQMLC